MSSEGFRGRVSIFKGRNINANDEKDGLLCDVMNIILRGRPLNGSIKDEDRDAFCPDFSFQEISRILLDG